MSEVDADIEFQAFKAAMDSADDYWQEMSLRSKNSVMPVDPLAWLDKNEAALPVALKKVSVEVAEEFKPLIEGQIRTCRRFLSFGEEEDAKVTMVVLAENLNRLKSNIMIHQSNVSKLQRKTAASFERPGARSPLKAKVIEVMSQHRASGMDFITFIEMWENSTIEGLRLTALNDSYLVEDEDSATELKQEYKFNTMRNKFWPSAKRHR